MSRAEQLARLINSLEALGFDIGEIKRLRRISSTLRRWAEAECNGEIMRDDMADDGTPGKPYRTSSYSVCRVNIPDREAGALKRLAAIMQAHPDLWAYHQGDPRGASLYVGRKSDLKTEENQIVAKARAWGWKGGSGFATQEIEAGEYLRWRDTSIPVRDLLPLDQHYMRGIAVY